MAKKHVEEAYAVLMYPKSARPYYAVRFDGSICGQTPLLFMNTAAALAWRQEQNVQRKSRTVTVRIRQYFPKEQG